jgi:hypothetical protein
LVGWRNVATAAVYAGAQIIHHDMGAMARQAQRMLAPDSTTCSGYNHHSTCTQFGHD